MNLEGSLYNEDCKSINEKFWLTSTVLVGRISCTHGKRVSTDKSLSFTITLDLHTISESGLESGYSFNSEEFTIIKRKF